MNTYRFQNFEVRTATRELFKHGHRIRIQPQAFRILCELLARPGELVTRQELAKALWGDQAWTDTDQGINIAVKKLRDALGDSADAPSLIETLPRLGYRFIGALERETPAEGVAEPVSLLPAPPAESSRGRLRWAVNILAATVLIAAAWTLWNAGARARRLDFHARDLVVVGQFANESGNKDLDGIVETALEAELSASPFVAIASQGRTNDLLRLMRQPATGRVPAPLLPQVCGRDPALKAAVGGAVRRFGGSYVLQTRIYRAGEDAPVAVLEETASGENDLLPAAARLGRSIRARLGEHLPAAAYERVATPSMAALKLYTDANNLGSNGRWKAAEVLLRQATEADPEFASAQLLLAWAMRNQVDRQASEYLPVADRALALADRATERESYFIRASHAHLLGDHGRAIPIYEALLERYPEHDWANNNLYRLYLGRSESGKVLDLVERQLKQRPNDPAGYFRAAHACFCSLNGNQGKAVEYADRGLALAGESRSEWARAHAGVQALAAWDRGDVRGARNIIETSGRPDAAASMTFGMVRQAEALTQDQADAAWWEVWRNVYLGRTKEAYLAAAKLAGAPPSERYAMPLLRAGRIEEAARLIARIRAPRYSRDTLAVSAGELELRRGNPKKAAEILTPAVAALAFSNHMERLLGAQTLARALATLRRLDEAIAVLERATLLRVCGTFGVAMFWPQARYDLMRLYEKRNRTAEAEAIRKELQSLLQLADPDLALKAALRPTSGISPGGAVKAGVPASK